MASLDRVEVGRYQRPDEVGFTGWIGTKDWIAFENLNGQIHIFHGRDHRTGGVLEDADSAILG